MAVVKMPNGNSLGKEFLIFAQGLEDSSPLWWGRHRRSLQPVCRKAVPWKQRASSNPGLVKTFKVHSKPGGGGVGGGACL